MKKYLFLAIMFLSSLCIANENWQQHWEHGKEYLTNLNYEEAVLELDLAVNLMSKEELAEYPYVLIDRAESDYFLKNYIKVIESTDRALLSSHLTDQERLECGMKRIAAYMQLNQESYAIEEYKKYIIGCPLFPKYNKFEDKIVIRNLPECECYKDYAKQFMMSKYCENESDIRTYGDMWIVNITKKCDCMKNLLITSRTSKRSPAEIEGCCNTCNRLATTANFICGCLPIPPQLGGPITKTACRLACVLLVETLREDCESCCYNEEGVCWSCFETWKEKFKKKNPNCGSPSKGCP